MDNDSGGSLFLIIYTAILLAAFSVSYLMLRLLPVEQKPVSWLILAGSAFLFCLSYFPLTGVLSSFIPEGTLAKLYTVYGLVLLIIGPLTVYRCHASGRSMTIATLFLIEGLVAASTAGGFSRHRYLLSLLMIVYAVCTIIFGIVFVIREKAEGTSIETATFMLISGIVLGTSGLGMIGSATDD